MKKIFNSNLDVAWIGESAPIPDGWSDDANSFALKAKEIDVRIDEKDILDMTKDELEAYARENFDVELDRRKRRDTLQLEVMELMGM
jgi:hypothetical protein